MQRGSPVLVCFVRFLRARRFRRNGVAVPAQRRHRSGETVSTFRGDGFHLACIRDGWLSRNVNSFSFCVALG